MRIGLITTQDPYNKKNWSGTLHSIRRVLADNFEVKVYYIREPFYCRVFQHINNWFVKAGIQPRKMYRYSIETISTRMNDKFTKLAMNDEVDAYIAVISNVVISNYRLKKPLIYVTDSVFSAMIDYYWYNLSDDTIVNGNKIEKQALQNADHVILSSHWGIESAINSYNLPISKVSLAKFGPNIDDEYLEKFKSNTWIQNNGDASINLLYIGVDWIRKGGQIAIEILKELNQRSSKTYKLDLIGDIPKTVVSDSNMTVHGFLNKNIEEDLEKFYEIMFKADLLLLPTKAECSAIVFSEAAALSIPVVTYDTGGVSDYVEDEYNGICLPLEASSNAFASAIDELMNNKEKYLSFKNNAKNKYEMELNWNVWVKKIKHTLEEL